MSIGRLRALWVLHRAFGRYPPAHRVHILVRFLTCPFTRMLDVVPRGSRVLEIGSGHALYSFLLAAVREASVVAVDPDLRKSFLASPSPAVHKVAGFDRCVRGEFDAVVIADVAYRLALAEQRALFERMFTRLRSGAVLALKELDPTSAKLRWARTQERISDRFLRITAGEGFHYQTPSELEAMLREIGFTGVTARRIDSGYPHPHILYTAAKP